MIAMGEPDPCREPHPRKLRYHLNRSFHVTLTRGRKTTTGRSITPRFTLSFSNGSSVPAFIHTLSSQLGNLSSGHLQSDLLFGIAIGHITHRGRESARVTHHPQQTGSTEVARHH